MHRGVLFVEEKEWIQSDRVLTRSQFYILEFKVNRQAFFLRTNERMGRMNRCERVRTFG